MAEECKTYCFLLSLDAKNPVAFITETSYLNALITKEYRTLNALFSCPKSYIK